MYRNDNDKKYALLAAIFAVLIFTLVACGKQMRELRGSAQDIARRVYEQAGLDASGMSGERVTAEEAYMLGISGEDFRENVAEAGIYRPAELSAEQSLCVVVAKSADSAEEIFEEMCEDYEWAPCDPAESAVFMRYGKYILLGKASAAGTRSLCEAFLAETGGEAQADFSQNPM